MNSEPRLLVVGSGGQIYREYLLAGAARRHPVWLLDAAEPTWQKRYVTGATVVPLIDRARLVPDQDGLIKAAQHVAAEQRVAGVFTYDETLVVVTAHIAETLGLPGLTVAGVEACRNKHRTRQVLTAAGLPQPRFALVHSVEEAATAADAIGYPVVLKPRGMGASIGVVRVAQAADLAWAFDIAHQASYGGNPAYEGGVLVEELVTGTEISVDGMVHQGRYEPLFLARKQVGPAPYFEEIGHVVDPDDELLSEGSLRDVLARAHRSLGLDTGITHTEVMLSQRGPVVIEVNARLGGDLIPYLGKLATGIDPGELAAALATGGTMPTVRPEPRGIVGIRFAYPPQDCRVTSLALPDPATVPGLLEAVAMASPGTELRLPPKGYISRYAYVICTGANRAECVAHLSSAIAATSLEFTPPQEDRLGLLG